MPYGEVMRLPMGEVKKLLRVIKARDVVQRVHAANLALLSQTPFSEEQARSHKDLVEAVVPEAKGGNQIVLDERKNIPTAGPETPQVDLKEQHTLDMLAQAGLFPVRKGRGKQE